jgi:hypothetical protein
MATNNDLKPISPKVLGMIHLPGVNDQQYAAYIERLKPAKEQVMVSAIENRW